MGSFTLFEIAFSDYSPITLTEGLWMQVRNQYSPSARRRSHLLVEEQALKPNCEYDAWYKLKFQTLVEV